MITDSNIKLTIAFNDSNLDNDELEAQAQNLLAQMRDLDEVETVDRVLDPNPPKGNKAIGGMLVGLLTAQVNLANAQKLLGFLGDRLGNKPIELEVEANGKKLKVWPSPLCLGHFWQCASRAAEDVSVLTYVATAIKASSQAELEMAIAAAQKFITA